MTRVYGELCRVLRKGSYAVAVVGNSYIAGREVDNGRVLAEAAEMSGLNVEGIVERSVAEKRSAFNRANSRGRKSEHIVIAKKAQ